MSKKEKTEKVPVEENTAEASSEKENQEALNDTEKSDDPTAKIAEWEDKYLRLFSEFENFRRRTTKEKVDLITSAKADTFKLLLPVLDNFDRALKSISEASDVESLKEGVNLIHHMMISTLNKEGLKEMEVKEQTFNAEEHEAITNIPAPSEDLKGKIVDVVEKGYILNEKIIRFPKVVVGN